MTNRNATDIETISAPWNKNIDLQEREYDGGFKVIRLRIKEGRRITDLELDSLTAARLGGFLRTWAEANPPPAAAAEKSVS
jgi:hypothetical protein